MTRIAAQVLLVGCIDQQASAPDVPAEPEPAVHRWMGDDAKCAGK